VSHVRRRAGPLNRLAWALAALYALDRLIKLLAVHRFLRRPAPPAPAQRSGVSLLQPITRGAADLPGALACRAALRYDGHVQHILICDAGIVEDAGLGQHFLYSGVHSVGVIEFEPPIFGPSSAAVIEPDMIISVDIPLFDAPWGGLRVEDGYRIGADGVERLNQAPYLITIE